MKCERCGRRYFYRVCLRRLKETLNTSFISLFKKNRKGTGNFVWRIPTTKTHTRGQKFYLYLQLCMTTQRHLDRPFECLATPGRQHQNCQSCNWCIVQRRLYTLQCNIQKSQRNPKYFQLTYARPTLDPDVYDIVNMGVSIG